MQRGGLQGTWGGTGCADRIGVWLGVRTGESLEGGEEWKGC